MAKTAKAKAPVVSRPRRVHRDDPEHWNRILIVGGVVAVILIAIGVIAYGWYATEVKPLGKTVLRVGDIEYSLGALERRLEHDLPDDLSGSDPLAYPEQVMQDLQREALLIQGSGELNITVTDEEVNAEIRTRGGLAEDVEPTLYAAEFRRQVEDSGLKESEYRQQLKAELYDNKVRQYFTYLAPPTEQQVRARWIVTDKEDDINAAALRLVAGEDFETVATDVSLDSVGSTKQADLDWSVRGVFGFIPQEVEDFIFTGDVGTTSGIIEDSGVFYIAQTLERDDNRALEDQQRNQIGIRDMNEWLSGLPDKIEIERNFSTDDAIKALNDVLP